VKRDVRKALVTLHLTCFLVLGAASCGGSSNGSGGGAGGPTAGEYLWEFSLIDSQLFFTTVDSSTGQLGAPTASGGMACNSLGAIPSIAVTPSNQFVFVIDKCFVGVHVYSIHGPGIALTEIPQSPYGFNGVVDSLAIDPSGKFLYVEASPGAIYQLAVNGSTGELTSIATTTETADLREVIADPNGKFVFANDLTGGRVFAYLIGGNGSLSPVSGSPFTVPANGQPANLVIESNGKFLYAPLISGGIAGFAVNGSTGALANMSGSPFPTISQPTALATDRAGRFLYSVGFRLNGIEGFSIDASTGALTSVTGSPFSTSSSLNSLAVDHSGKFLYASVNAMTLGGSVILGFAIDTSSGSLTALATSPYPAAPFPEDVVSLNIP
jgi:6-phosphogluconolactonase